MHDGRKRAKCRVRFQISAFVPRYITNANMSQEYSLLPSDCEMIESKPPLTTLFRRGSRSNFLYYVLCLITLCFTSVTSFFAGSYFHAQDLPSGDLRCKLALYEMPVTLMVSGSGPLCPNFRLQPHLRGGYESHLSSMERHSSLAGRILS